MQNSIGKYRAFDLVDIFIASVAILSELSILGNQLADLFILILNLYISTFVMIHSKIRLQFLYF